MARELGVPQPIIDKPPSAGLWVGQTDEAEMGFSYADLERYLADGPEGVSPAFALRLERLIRSTEHKRALPPDRLRAQTQTSKPDPASRRDRRQRSALGALRGASSGRTWRAR